MGFFAPFSLRMEKKGWAIQILPAVAGVVTCNNSNSLMTTPTKA